MNFIAEGIAIVYELDGSRKSTPDTYDYWYQDGYLFLTLKIET